ncbi:hypothetical protein RRG08_020209 [Elysia crispata]|uniref:Uncharacterized protein n=1 Tax=Elysia crispata TaxID=231223 RepID=A0AAE1DR65_9GAST|nr:hypothetical protein RRG08_020209 [Elysia crispata]
MFESMTSRRCRQVSPGWDRRSGRGGGKVSLPGAVGDIGDSQGLLLVERQLWTTRGHQGPPGPTEWTMSSLGS